MIDLQLFAVLAVGVVLVGSYLWFKPRPGGKASKKSGIGDMGQKG